MESALLSSCPSVAAQLFLSTPLPFRRKSLRLLCSASPSTLGRRALLLTVSTPFLLPSSAHAVPECRLPILQEEIRKLLSKNRAPGLLRLVFHDAGTFDLADQSGGMNGSIVYELDRPENSGLAKPVKFLGLVKSQLDAICSVSWADLIAVAGAEAVSICGGPQIPVQLGRIDASSPDPEAKLPEESLDASTMKRLFQTKGFSVQEMVALSGAHTLGSKGFGNPVVFDNSYYKILMQKPWVSSPKGAMSSMIGLPSDRALADDRECVRWISKYADDQNTFFDDFRDAYIKLVNTGAKWKTMA